MRCCTWRALNLLLRCPLETRLAQDVWRVETSLCSGCLTCRDFVSLQLPETWGITGSSWWEKRPLPHRIRELSEASLLENSIFLLFFSLIQNPGFICSRLHVPREIHRKIITYSSVMSNVECSSQPATQHVVWNLLYIKPPLKSCWKIPRKRAVVSDEGKIQHRTHNHHLQSSVQRITQKHTAGMQVATVLSLTSPHPCFMPGSCLDKAAFCTHRQEVVEGNWVTELTETILILWPDL